MAALVCDLCGGKLVMGSGGIATCDSCGMEHSPERMREKVQEVKGVVQVDSSHLVENYLRMAQNAYDSGNKAEAENYCNKILETVPNHQQAWLLKGRAAGWQSTLGNIRFAEAINCFANAVANTEEAEKQSVINECKREVGELAEALIRLRGERFAKWPDAEEKNGFIADLTVILQAILQFFNSVGTLINKDELMEPLATIINNSVLNAWKNVVRPTFANDHDGHPDDYELKRLIDRAGHCTDLLEKAIDLSDSDVENDIQYYQNLIAIHEYLINAQSYSYETVKIGYSKWDGSTQYDNQYVVSKCLTDNAKSQRKGMISKYNKKIEAIKSAAAARETAEKEQSKTKFWSRFQKERALIGDTMIRLEIERTHLSSSNTGYNQILLIDAMYQQLSEILNQDRSAQGVFSDKEQKTLASLPNIWTQLKKTESVDGFYDKNPLLKEEPQIRNNLKKNTKSLSDAYDEAPENWVPRIAGCVLLLGIFIWFAKAFLADFSRGTVTSYPAAIFLSLLVLVPALWGAIACVKNPIKRTIANKKLIARLERYVQEDVAQINQIETLKAQAKKEIPSFDYTPAPVDMPVKEASQTLGKVNKKLLITGLVFILIGIILLTIMYVIIDDNYTQFGYNDHLSFGAYFEEEALNIDDFGGMTIATAACMIIGLVTGLMAWVKRE